MTAVAAAAACVGVEAEIAWAHVWDNSSGDALWSNPVNWVQNTEPGAANSAEFPIGFPNGDSTITLSNGETADSLSISGNYTLSGGSLAVGSGIIIAEGAGTTPVINSVLTGSGGLIKFGLGTLVLGGTNTFSGQVHPRTGAIEISADANLGNPGNGFILDGGALVINGGVITTSRTFTVDAAFGSGGTLTPVGATTFILNGPVNGSAPLVTNGSGTLVFNAAGARNGVNQINSGTVRLGHNTALGTGEIQLNNSANLELSSGISVSQQLRLNNTATLRAFSGSSNYAGNIIVGTSANVVLSSGGGNTLTIGDATHSYQGGSGAITSITGSGTIVLPFASSYAGGWSVNSGTLRIAHPSATGTDASGLGLTANGGTVEIGGVSVARGLALNDLSTLRGNGAATTTGIVNILNGSNVTLATGASASDTLTIGDNANELAGGGNVTVSGGGTVILAQSSLFTGQWILAGGTLQIAADNRFGNAANSIVFSGGTLRTSGAVTSARNPIIDAGGGTINTNGFDSTFGTFSGSGSLNKTGNGNLTAMHIRIGGALNISGGKVTVTVNGTSTGTSRVSAVSVNSALDLKDNKLIVAGGDLGSWNGSAYTGITGLVDSGRGNGSWNGNGVVTSMSDATSGVLTTLAVALAEDVGYAGGTFGGLTVSAGDVLVMYTWGGDAELDGDLDGDDYFWIDSSVALSGSVFGFNNGDFDYDGDIDGDDYFIIDSNIAFAQTQPPFPTSRGAPGLTSVPEPGYAYLALAGLLAQRWRKPMRWSSFALRGNRTGQ